MPTDPYDVPMRDLTGRQIGKARVYTKSDGLSYAVPLPPETTLEPTAPFDFTALKQQIDDSHPNGYATDADGTCND